MIYPVRRIQKIEIKIFHSTEDYVGLCRIRSDSVGFGWVWLDLVGFGWIWSDSMGVAPGRGRLITEMLRDVLLNRFFTTRCEMCRHIKASLL